MFYRGLYFVIPDEHQAVRIAEDLVSTGIKRQSIHAIVGKGVTLTQLPPANELQRHDAVWSLERGLWIGNLLLFSLALIGFIGSMILGAYLWTVDVPKWRVAEVEEIVYRRHPEATPGGTGWTIRALGIQRIADMHERS